MRKRIALAMMLLVLLLVPTSLYLMVTHSFDQAINRNEQASLREEAAIARALITEIKTSGQNTYTSALNSAQTLQKKYGSQDVALVLLYNHVPMAGASVPEEIVSCGLIETQSRSVYLSSSAQTFYIAHKLSDNVVLLVGSDYSGLYEDHKQTLIYAGLICGFGLLLALVLAMIVANGLTRPLRSLVCAAHSLRDGNKSINLPELRKDEIGELMTAFKDMAESIENREQELADQVQRKQELTDALAHEMRTPLTAIVGAARMIQKDPRQIEEMSELIAHEAMRLSTMDDDLMRLTQLSHEQPEFIRFSSMEMAKEAISAFDSVCLFGKDAEFIGNRALLIQLLRNLITNAIRSETKEPVQVVLNPDGFSVKDNGCGMTTEQISHIFDPYWKADKARTRKNGGSGLGLTLCAKIAELHKANLLVDSQPGHGTTFTLQFTTPLQPLEDSET